PAFERPYQRDVPACPHSGGRRRLPTIPLLKPRSEMLPHLESERFLESEQQTGELINPRVGRLAHLRADRSRQGCRRRAHPPNLDKSQAAADEGVSGNPGPVRRVSAIVFPC